MKNPNSITEFSQALQRASRFLEPVDCPDQPLLCSTVNSVAGSLNEQTSIQSDEAASCSTYKEVSNWPNYGAIGCGAKLSDHRRFSGLSHHGRPTFSLGKNAAETYVRLIEENLLSPRDEVTQFISGRSTVPMSIFNCTNTLIGVGILALPLGLQQCGWVVGLVLLTLPAVVTAYTAKLLVKCLDRDPTAVTYGDIAHMAFGSIGRHFVEVLFVFELIAANVALVILFADSVGSLAPMLSVTTWKIIIATSLIPLNFAPLRILSVSSAIGIFCVVGILALLVSTGLTKPDAPGSLLHLAHTRALPTSWKAIPATLGLFMAPWGGHSIFPAVYKDMRHPQKYSKALAYTYSITYSLALSIAAVGYVMFGDGVLTEITSNILELDAYPRIVSVLTLALVAVVPVTKIALINRPLMDTVNRKLDVSLLHREKAQESADRKHGIVRFVVGASCNVLELMLAIMVPNFDDVIAFMGSALCITICIILPAGFYLRVCGGESCKNDLFNKSICWSLIAIGSVCAICGTLSAVLGGAETS
ncbi:hypothetical protein HRR83_004135 [Exophiala dermatitidis]|nr:hypothetical protein HRR75_003099 [Exophiala dermatitidis]KAJ4521561.1 hypothetical protein HRR74_003385 [Exophiala dermatitidis]KAJ4533357.1 hypothetical protein HRR77_008705 [Exophiala dermatitidis]KAJ4545005.1 hypothetical protein HRR76_003037 [Exophiala dermatitidis]KAJ4554998.1 hypothetical protein HRR79_009110 [Exophiala dermatitidis]